MDVKCRCGQYARVNMGMEWVCWECRAIDLRGTHEEDWRDFELRAMAKKLGLGLKQGETTQDLATRSRAMFRPLAEQLGDKYANNSTKQSTPPP